MSNNPGPSTMPIFTIIALVVEGRRLKEANVEIVNVNKPSLSTTMFKI